MYEKKTKIPLILAVFVGVSLLLFAYYGIKNGVSIFPIMYRGSLISSCHYVTSSVIYAFFTILYYPSFLLILAAICTLILVFLRRRKSFAGILLLTLVAVTPFVMLIDTNSIFFGVNIVSSCNTKWKSFAVVLQIPIVCFCLYIICGNFITILKEGRVNE